MGLADWPPLVADRDVNDNSYNLKLVEKSTLGNCYTQDKAAFTLTRVQVRVSLFIRKVLGLFI